ncbi:hypothetical protein [Kibdelosporangium phytohabitans]|uniref:Uncharacterized protein n=1 Tax=Kibdelosporangium phytohabitans TaxID=860235 RepID=A0A0N9HMS7_9PSEU|nr:hypothetical protein [Kibdelosporangium phytohabitans]ALG08154.1 hypothetical protein AOZ06_15645 [Kibdelosporangium phytohabitans]MBE1470860.1 hypothetical protein [Kibdelosporangium phytohabitans]
MSEDQTHTASPGYATGQLARALARLVESGDQGALRKIRQWEAVLAGMTSGNLTVGSRTPVAGTPAWVTLEVAHGGFATGEYLAEVPLTDDETAKLLRLPDDVPGETDRERLNLWYLGDAGQAELLAALRTGHYRVDVPEDAALAVVALLLDRGFAEQALDLVAELRPLAHRLRFTPRFEPVARTSGTAVRLATVSEVTGSLREVVMPQQIAAMRTTLSVWNPLYDRLVALWCETVDGDLPYLEAGSVRGGWPCRRQPEGWADRRAHWLADYASADRPVSGRHAHPRSNFARLHAALRNSDTLSARDVGWVRRAIANTVTKAGAPGSTQRSQLRDTQAAVAALPTNEGLAGVLIDRLGRYPADGGLSSLDRIAADVSDQDTRDVPAGTPIPVALRDKAARALEAPADELVRRGVIPSGEVLATVLPQLTSRLMSSGIEDPVAAGLYEQTYTAFRRRRSLLLLNLEHQVRFSELPWARALSVFRVSTRDETAAVRRALRQVTMLAITEFPHAILPNPLVAELGALTGRAGLKLPLVEEVAADIFMGRFTRKWQDAALVASRTMAGTLYSDYYDLPGESTWTGERKTTWWNRRRTADVFGELCERRAREAGLPKWRSTAGNGAIIEQSQILTTHNLAVLVTELDLADQVRERAGELAWHTFDWVVRRLTQPADSGHAALIQVKNAAYAWRQAIFLLSFATPEQQKATVRKLGTHVHDVGIDSWFRPAVRGLSGVLRGERFDSAGTVHGGKRFLGWAVGEHWALSARGPAVR